MNNERMARTRWGMVWRHVAELLILGGLAIAGTLIPVVPPALPFMTATWRPPIDGAGLTLFARGSAALHGPAIPGLLLMLLTIRFARTRLQLFLGFLAALVVPYLIIHFAWSHQIYKTFYSDPHNAMFAPVLAVPFWASSLRMFLIFLLPILSALYCVRRGFRWLKYLGGWAVMLALVHVILFWSWPLELIPAFMLAVVLNGLTASAIVALPLQRQALQRLTGLKLSATGDGAAPLPGAGHVTWLVGHSLLLITTVLLVAMSILGVYEYRFLRDTRYGVTPPNVCPGGTNAYDILRPHFVSDAWMDSATRARRQREDPLTQWTTSLNERTRNVMGGFPVVTTPTLALVIADLPRREVNDYLTSLTPHIRTLEAAAEADYLFCWEPNKRMQLDSRPLRTMARALTVRAGMAIADNRPEDALRDARTLLRISWLMSHDASAWLISHMIAPTIRRMGISVLENYFLCYRNDPEALGQLRAMLAGSAYLVHVDFPAEILRRTEPAMQPVAIHFELTALAAPGCRRLYFNYYTPWALYDELVLCAALQAWHNDKGSYPERLEQLVPDYLPFLPKDPHEGKPYIYARVGETYRVRSAYNLKISNKIGKSSPHHWNSLMPLSERDAKEETQYLAKLRGNAGEKTR